MPGGSSSERPSSLPPSSEPLTASAEEGIWKRKYYALLETVPGDYAEPHGTAVKHSRKKKRAAADEVSTVCLGRGIPKVVSLFEDVRSIIEQADYHELRVRGLDGADDMLEDCNDEERAVILADHARAYYAREALYKILPNFYRHIDDYTPEQLVQYYSNLEKGAGDARAADILGIRRAIAMWLNCESPPPSPILDPEGRANRGVQHDLCGMLLCPVDYDWDDPSVRTQIRNLEDGYDISSSFFIRALYQGYNGNPNNYQKGFFKSALLVKVYKYLFTSPSSAKTVEIKVNDAVSGNEENLPPAPNAHRPSRRKNANRKNVSNTLQMNDTVTPRAIAYSAIMLVFNLSSADSWGKGDGDMDYHSLYNFIIDYFEAAEGAKAKSDVKALLKWWNDKVYPHARARAPQNKAGSMTKLREQRAAAENRH